MKKFAIYIKVDSLITDTVLKFRLLIISYLEEILQMIRELTL